MTFDLVPHNNITNGLNYAATTVTPARGVVVEAVGAANQSLANTVTDDAGAYSLEVEANTEVRIRVYAQLLSENPSWDFQVTDNTDENALYAIQGTLLSAGDSDSTRDLHASSGWGGSAYTSTRAAAPFAILDAVYASLEKIVEADPDVVLTPAEFRWSTENRATPGNPEIGDIGNSHFSSAENAVYILGSEDNDTDEYDRHVVSHEFSHYLEYNLSRSDSIGGGHSLTNDLDMRVAFGEGYANAFAAIFMESPIYRDSAGSSQAFGFDFDVSQNNTTSPGWFSEDSIQNFLYALYENDTNNFNAIFTTLTSDTYIESDALTGIHLFGTLLKQQNPGLITVVDSLAAMHEFTLTDIWGSDETNDGDTSETLPIYKELEVNGSAVTVCSTNAAGEFNKLNNIAYILVDLPSQVSYTITASRSSGLTTTNPDFWFIQQGQIYGIGNSDFNNIETLESVFNAGPGIILVWEASNRDEEDGGGNACFNVSITH